jgi:hypothetical protein
VPSARSMLQEKPVNVDEYLARVSTGGSTATHEDG